MVAHHIYKARLDSKRLAVKFAKLLCNAPSLSLASHRSLIEAARRPSMCVARRPSMCVARRTSTRDHSRLCVESPEESQSEISKQRSGGVHTTKRHRYRISADSGFAVEFVANSCVMLQLRKLLSSGKAAPRAHFT